MNRTNGPAKRKVTTIALFNINKNIKSVEISYSYIIIRRFKKKLIFSVTGRRTPAKKPQPSSLAEAMMLDTEAAVMANLDFLSNADVDMEDDDDMSDDVDIEPSDDLDDDVKVVKRKGTLYIVAYFYLDVNPYMRLLR